MSTIINNTATVRADVGSSATIFPGTKSTPRRVRLLADRNIFVAVGVSPEADEETALPVAEMREVFLAVPANADISIITKSGEPSGSVWVTEV